MYILLFQKWGRLAGIAPTTFGRGGNRPHAVGAITPIARMDSAPLVLSWNCVIIKLPRDGVARYCHDKLSVRL